MMFTATNTASMDYAVPFDAMVFSVPHIMYVVFYMFTPCENLIRNDQKLIEILLENEKHCETKICSRNVRIRLVKTNFLVKKNISDRYTHYSK